MVRIGSNSVNKAIYIRCICDCLIHIEWWGPWVRPDLDTQTITVYARKPTIAAWCTHAIGRFWIWINTAYDCCDTMQTPPVRPQLKTRRANWSVPALLMTLMKKSPWDQVHWNWSRRTSYLSIQQLKRLLWKVPESVRLMLVDIPNKSLLAIHNFCTKSKGNVEETFSSYYHVLTMTHWPQKNTPTKWYLARFLTILPNFSSPNTAWFRRPSALTRERQLNVVFTMLHNHTMSLQVLLKPVFLGILKSKHSVFSLDLSVNVLHKATIRMRTSVYITSAGRRACFIETNSSCIWTHPFL